MKIPEQIKVGGTIFDVAQYEHAHPEHGTQVRGAVDFDAKTISLAGCRDLQANRSVLTHEIVHAVLCFMTSDLYGDENFVGLLANSLEMVLVDNPTFVAMYLEGGQKKGTGKASG